MKKSSLFLTLFLTVALAGCASVPREVVELSYVMGSDINELQRRHEHLVRLHFDGLRQRTDTFLMDRWQPTFLRHFIEEGDLVGAATDPDPNEVLLGVHGWATVALEMIQAKRHELIDPLDKQEIDLLTAIDAAYERLRTSNATITAHLNSIREVDEMQSAALDSLGLGDLRQQLDRGLARASEIVDEGILRTTEADHLVDKAQELRDRVGGQ